jgi:hypothetical protein
VALISIRFMMRSFSCQLGFGADNVRTRKPVYTTGFRLLGTAKPTLPELTPETKGIAEVDRHSAVREHRNGDRGAWMGRGKRRAEIRPLPGASPGVQDKLPVTRRDDGAWLREPLQVHQQSSEQHNHLALIRPADHGAAELGVFRIWVSGRRPNLRGVLPLSALAFSLQIVPGVASTIWFGAVVVD